jgi:hypothetical protein
MGILSSSNNMGTLSLLAQANSLSALSPSPLPPVLSQANSMSALSPSPPWIAVYSRFNQFHQNLALTDIQFQDGMKKYFGVVSCLNSYYYGKSPRLITVS